MSKIITAGNPILTMTAEPVTEFDKKLKFLVNDMKKTLYEANGVGLAAITDSLRQNEDIKKEK